MARRTRSWCSAGMAIAYWRWTAQWCVYPRIRPWLGEAKLTTLDSAAQGVPKNLLQLAQSESSMWLAFDHLRRALGEATWTTSIRSMFEESISGTIPQIYLDLWGLKINGFFTLNIDRLAARAFSSCFPGR